jgi:Tol biopolymer transport system component
MRYKLLLTAFATLLAIGVGWIASAESTFTGTTTLVTQGGSTAWSVSADGRYTTFGDGWLYDRLTGTAIRIDPSFQWSDKPVISADGRYVAFQAYWYPEGGDGRQDIFVRDLETEETTRVSVDSQGNPANDESGIFPSAISADGRYVAFFSFATNLVPQGTPRWGDIFVHDRVTGQTELVSVDSNGNRPSNGNACAPAISADGRYVAFYSSSSGLVPDDMNGSPDIFVHDRQTGETTRVSVDSAGNEGNGNNGGHPPSARTVSMSLSIPQHRI